MEIMETLPPVWMLTSAVFTLLTVMISCAYISLKQKRVALPLALASPTTDTPTATRWETDDRGAGDGEMDAVESSDASIDHDANDDGLKNTWETRNWSTTTGEERNEGSEERDPVEYCEHIQSEVKKTRQRLAQRKLESNMTADQHVAERQAQQQQLEAIYQLMGGTSGTFGIDCLADVQHQMKLYK